MCAGPGKKRQEQKQEQQQKRTVTGKNNIHQQPTDQSTNQPTTVNTNHYKTYAFHETNIAPETLLLER